MKSFSYKAYNAQGRSVKGLVEALDPKDARERLSSEGVYVQTLVSAEVQGASSTRRKQNGGSLHRFVSGVWTMPRESSYAEEKFSKRAAATPA